MFEKKNILGVGVTDTLMENTLEYIEEKLLQDNKKHLIATINPEILTRAYHNVEYKKILNSADLALIDGVGVILAGKILGKQLRNRVTGVDLLEKLCQRVAEKPITVGFLGAGPKVAEKTAECLIGKYPNLKISFIGQEWNNDGFARAKLISKVKSQNSKLHLKSQKSKNEGKIIQNTKYMIHDILIDILFVAFGAPKQEIWINENLGKIPVKIAVGVGGALDYVSGRVQRAPLLVRLIGFEWLFRLINQPWRWSRQLHLLEFIWLVFKERIRFNKI